MVNPLPPRQRHEGAGDGRPIVAFDFDGTLTVKDSFTAYLRWRAGSLGYAAGMARLAPAALHYLAHRDRGRLKARAAAVFLRADTREALAASCETFAAAAFDRLIRSDARRAWDDWRGQAALMTIVTASPEEVVAPFARRLGADALLGTRLAYDQQDRVTGAFTGDNCRGEEKVRRLRERFGEAVRLAAAYGDSSGDTEMLAMAREAGLKVFRERPGSG